MRESHLARACAVDVLLARREGTASAAVGAYAHDRLDEADALYSLVAHIEDTIESRYLRVYAARLPGWAIRDAADLAAHQAAQVEVCADCAVVRAGLGTTALLSA